MALLKAFEGALKEGLLLDEALGGILGAALHYFDAPVVALLPGNRKVKNFKKSGYF
jgi:hypothetical protein